MNFAGQVGIISIGRLQHYLGAICEFVGSKIDLAEGSLANEFSEGVIADMAQLLRGELIQ